MSTKITNEILRQIIDDQINWLNEAKDNDINQDEYSDFYQNGWVIEEYFLKYTDEKSNFFKECVSSWGGEGEGDNYGRTFRVVHPEYGQFYVSYLAYHDSWNGVDWCYDPIIVEPVEVTRIEYREVK